METILIILLSIIAVSTTIISLIYRDKIKDLNDYIVDLEEDYRETQIFNKHVLEKFYKYYGMYNHVKRTARNYRVFAHKKMQHYKTSNELLETLVECYKEMF
jgi:hypothetical protein